nr:MAG TPA: hypothetical protein [Caudoviricetes sp.]
MLQTSEKYVFLQISFRLSGFSGRILSHTFLYVKRPCLIHFESNQPIGSI